MQKTPNEKIQIRTTATMLVCPPTNHPKIQKSDARMSTTKMAPVSCHDGMELQKGPLARVMKISQFSVKEICRKSTSSIFPKFWTMPPFSPLAYIVVTVIHVPTARTHPSRTDIPQSLGKFHLTGLLENGALSYAMAKVATSAKIAYENRVRMYVKLLLDVI